MSDSGLEIQLEALRDMSWHFGFNFDRIEFHDDVALVKWSNTYGLYDAADYIQDRIDAGTLPMSI